MMPMTPSGTRMRATSMPVGRHTRSLRSPDRIGQRRDLLEPVGHLLDERRREREAIDERRVAAVLLRLRDVVAIGREQLRHVGANLRRHGGERAVLRRRFGARQHARGGARRLAQAAHIRLYVKLLIHRPILTPGR